MFCGDLYAQGTYSAPKELRLRILLFFNTLTPNKWMPWYRMQSHNNYSSRVLNNGNSCHHHHLCLRKLTTEGIPSLFLTLEVKILFWVRIKPFYSWLASLGTYSAFLHQNCWYSKGQCKIYIERNSNFYHFIPPKVLSAWLSHFPVT